MAESSNSFQLTRESEHKAEWLTHGQRGLGDFIYGTVETIPGPPTEPRFADMWLVA